MTSVQSRFSQRDTRFEQISLTGSIANNGTIDSPFNDNPAYAEINLTKAQNFLIDTRTLILRTDPGGAGIEYLLRIYMTPTKPPLYYQNFEWTMFITLPNTSGKWIAIQIFNTKEEAESVDNNFIYELSNESPDGVNIYTGTAAITMQVMNNKFILKSVSPQLFIG